MKGKTQEVCAWDKSNATFARRTVSYVARMQIACVGDVCASNVEKLSKNHLYFTSRIEKNYV